MYLLSLLTVTYNRPQLIERLYYSIIHSPFDKNLIEWIIVVNGRKENLESIEKIINWMTENKINIKYYIIEENKGLSRALNFFNSTPTTSYFNMRIDDDDILNPDLNYDNVQFITETLTNYRDMDEIGFILNMNDHSKKLIGTELPKDKIPRSNFYFHYRFNLKGDKSRIYPTRILKRFNYKIFENEKYSPDSQTYYEMDSVLKLIPLNLSPIVREYLSSGLTKSSSKLISDNLQSILNANIELISHHEAKFQDKAKIFFKSIIAVLKTNKYYMVNKVKPLGLNWLFFIFLYPIYKSYIFFKNIKKK